MTRDGRWSTNFDRCIDCSRTDRAHKCRGRCFNCHHIFRYSNDPVFRDKVRRRSKAWTLNNYERMRASVDQYKARHKEEVKRWNNNYRRRLRRIVKVEIAGVLISGHVQQFHQQDGERVADVLLPSGQVVTFPISQLQRATSIMEAAC